MTEGRAAGAVHEVRVPEVIGPLRVDRYVSDVTGLSRSYVQRLIAAGHLTSEGIPLKANSVVGPGTRLRLEVPPAAQPETAAESEIDLRVVYEDPDVLIIDKPAGLVVHPAPGHSGGTLVNALLGRGGAEAWGGIAGVARPGIVHRLDRDTSGLLMVARNDAAQASLMSQLKARRVKKTYLALVWGSVTASVGRIEAPIGRDPRHRTRMAVVTDGRAAVTGYRVRERFAGFPVRIEMVSRFRTKTAQTQAIFDLDAFEEWMHLVRKEWLHEKLHILAGVVPLKSLRAARFMNEKVPGVVVPADVLRRLEKAPDAKAEGLAIAIGVVEANMRPCLAPVIAPVHAIAERRVVARVLLAGPDVDDVRVRWCQLDRTD